MSIKFFPGSAIFSGDNKIYLVESVVVFVLGLGFLISAFFSTWTTGIFYLMAIVGMILVIVALILIILILER